MAMPQKAGDLRRRGCVGPILCRRRQVAGQALVLFVTFLGVLCLAVILLFNTGQVVNKKVRLTNAVDAAAYSVAAEEARKLNFAAYMNRGRVANEVAVAQLVSVWSYYNFVQNHVEMHREISQWLAMIPIVNIIAGPINAAYTGIDTALDTARTPIHNVVKIGVRTLDEINGGLAMAADEVIASGGDETGQIAAVSLADAVLERNDPHAELAPSARSVLSGQVASAHDVFIQRFELPRRGTTSRGMDRYRNVVMESRDWFSRDRNSVLPVIPEISVGPLTAGLSVREHGGTDMVEYDRWAGLDAMSLVPKLTAEQEICFPFAGCETIEVDVSPPDVPWGGGGAQAVESNRGQAFDEYRDGAGFDSARNYEGAHYKPYNDVGSMPLAAAWARNLPVPKDHPRSEAYLEDYEGLRDYDDIEAGRALTPEDGPVFTVYARSGSEQLRTSDRIGLGGRNGATTHLAGSEANAEYTALASAQVYFSRPMALDQFKRRLFGKQREHAGLADVGEAGSLFSPFWQARLVETGRDTRASLGLVAP